MISEQFEFIDTGQLAERWKLPESWIREQVRHRCNDPLPHVRKHAPIICREGIPVVRERTQTTIDGTRLPKNLEVLRSLQRCSNPALSDGRM